MPPATPIIGPTPAFTPWFRWSDRYSVPGCKNLGAYLVARFENGAPEVVDPRERLKRTQSRLATEEQSLVFTEPEGRVKAVPAKRRVLGGKAFEPYQLVDLLKKIRSKPPHKSF